MEAKRFLKTSSRMGFTVISLLRLYIDFKKMFLGHFAINGGACW
jgi:hypothetical protein